MNFIRKEIIGPHAKAPRIPHAGYFVLVTDTDRLVCPLGWEIEIVLRSAAEVDGGDYLKYLVEIKKSLIHDNEPLSRDSLATLLVPMIGADAQIAKTVFTEDAFGSTHRLGLQKYEVGLNQGYIMTINGLLWDGQIRHVRNIAI
jgi:hypothetical protein